MPLGCQLLWSPLLYFPRFYPGLYSPFPTCSQRDPVKNPSQTMSLLCSEPSMAPTSCRENVKVLLMTHKALHVLPPSPPCLPLLPLPPSLTLLQPHLLAASYLRAFALAVPTAWKPLPLMAPSLISHRWLLRCHLLSEAVPALPI